MQSYDNDQHPQQLNDALTEPSSVQAPQAPSSKQDASPPLKQDKTQLKLKRKKNLHEAEKHKLLDAADTSVTPAAQEDEPPIYRISSLLADSTLLTIVVGSQSLTRGLRKGQALPKTTLQSLQNLAEFNWPPIP